ncbi:hypothetical protein LCGC14_2164020, partial [marine sediment metagenome]
LKGFIESEQAWHNRIEKTNRDLLSEMGIKGD